MLIVNDYAVHQRTGKVGKVVGYGHQIANDSYLLTLKVLINESIESGKSHSVVEDIISRWMPMK